MQDNTFLILKLKFYQLAFLTPGIWPLYASSLKQIRQMPNFLKYAWGLSLDRTINTVLMVDEAHMLLADQNTLGAEFLARIQRRSRKYNTGTIIITQQPTDFAAPNVLIHGKAIFDNASYYLVMGLKKQAVDDLSKLIDLNDQEKDSIKRYSQGQALFVCGNRRMRINVIATQAELESFGGGGGF